jgi:hypothetical protein
MTEAKNGMSKSERFKNYFIGIGATTGLVLGLLAQFRGEPMAEKTWTTLRDQVNKQTERINELYVRMESFQAAQRARDAVRLEYELDGLRKNYEQLQEKEARPLKKGRRPASTRKTEPKKEEKSTPSFDDALLSKVEAEHDILRQMAEHDMPQQKPLETLPKKLEDAAKK